MQPLYIQPAWAVRSDRHEQKDLPAGQAVKRSTGYCQVNVMVQVHLIFACYMSVSIPA